MNAHDIEPGAELDLTLLDAQWMGCQLRSLVRVTSTNDKAWEWAAQGAPHGAVVVAVEQSRGRGRQGRRWISPAGVGLYLSMLLRPKAGPSIMAPFSLVVALAVAEQIEAMSGASVGLKWPNDVWLDGRKCAGILLESRSIEAASSDVGPLEGLTPTTPEVSQNPIVAGIGLNVRQPEDGWPLALSQAVSLEEATGLLFDRGGFVAGLLKRVEEAYDLFVTAGFGPFQAAWQARSILRDARVLVHEGDHRYMALALDLDMGGRLRVRDDNGQEKWLQAAEVHLTGTTT